jgi:hypothetical protein
MEIAFRSQLQSFNPVSSSIRCAIPLPPPPLNLFVLGFFWQSEVSVFFVLWCFKIGLAAASSPTTAVDNPVPQQHVVVNGQEQPSSEQLISPDSTAEEAGTPTATTTSTAGTGGVLGITPGTTSSSSNKFVLTPEYIQHSEYSRVL